MPFVSVLAATDRDGTVLATLPVSTTDAAVLALMIWSWYAV